jgi:hypothetical protein
VKVASNDEPLDDALVTQPDRVMTARAGSVFRGWNIDFDDMADR